MTNPLRDIADWILPKKPPITFRVVSILFAFGLIGVGIYMDFVSSALTMVIYLGLAAAVLYWLADLTDPILDLWRSLRRR